MAALAPRSRVTGPAVSVVLPVHNAARWLEPCLASILAQDFAGFELVALDDASTDGSAAILDACAARDPRIRVERSDVRLGAAGSSNRATELARAPLVARMDADDLMLPGRLAAQVTAFADRPDCVLIGGLHWTIDAAGHRTRAPDLARALRTSRYAPFAHATVMFRREAWERCGGYAAAAEKWEDVDFFLRMAAVGGVATLARPLIEYRQHADSSRFLDGLDRLEHALDAMCRAVEGARPVPGRIAPGVYRHVLSTLLWSGGRPALLPRILHHASLRSDRQTLALLLLACAAQGAPGALRTALRARLRIANAAARRRLAGGTLLPWQPPPQR